MVARIPIEQVQGSFTVCKVSDFSEVDLGNEFTFVSKTDTENSLVCRTANVPLNAYEAEDGWAMMRVVGKLDFSLIGILSKISTALANKGMGVFVISTYDTDYVLVKEENLDEALGALALI